jgi:hypothetical protein
MYTFGCKQSLSLTARHADWQQPGSLVHLSHAARAAVLCLLFAAVAVYPARRTPVADFVFSWEGPTYEATWHFPTDCPPDSLQMVFFLPTHVRRCISRANLTITVQDSGQTSNQIAYTYSYLISKLRLRFLRVLDSAAHRVTFTMEACSVSGSSIVPNVLSSIGTYTVVDTGGGWQVQFHQVTTLDRDLNELYMHFIRNDTRRVLRNQERYSRERRWNRAE